MCLPEQSLAGFPPGTDPYPVGERGAAVDLNMVATGGNSTHASTHHARPGRQLELGTELALADV